MRPLGLTTFLNSPTDDPHEKVVVRPFGLRCPYRMAREKPVGTSGLTHYGMARIRSHFNKPLPDPYLGRWWICETWRMALI